jgi:hypothetical protein
MGVVAAGVGGATKRPVAGGSFVHSVVVSPCAIFACVRASVFCGLSFCDSVLGASLFSVSAFSASVRPRSVDQCSTARWWLGGTDAQSTEARDTDARSVWRHGTGNTDSRSPEALNTEAREDDSRNRRHGLHRRWAWWRRAWANRPYGRSRAGIFCALGGGVSVRHLRVRQCVRVLWPLFL